MVWLTATMGHAKCNRNAGSAPKINATHRIGHRAHMPMPYRCCWLSWDTRSVPEGTARGNGMRGEARQDDTMLASDDFPFASDFHQQSDLPGGGGKDVQVSGRSGCYMPCYRYCYVTSGALVASPKHPLGNILLTKPCITPFSVPPRQGSQTSISPPRADR